MTEVWKDIKGYEGQYTVSNTGKVKSFKGAIPKILAPRVGANGYERVVLYTKGHNKSRTVHTLVLEAFFGEKTDPTFECRHLDGNYVNNNIENLKWGTKRRIEQINEDMVTELMVSDVEHQNSPILR